MMYIVYCILYAYMLCAWHMSMYAVDNAVLYCTITYNAI